jgi:hypothetical protein
VGAFNLLTRFATAHKFSKGGLVIFFHLMTIKPLIASIAFIHEIN